jgi:hypothetical protein
LPVLLLLTLIASAAARLVGVFTFVVCLVVTVFRKAWEILALLLLSRLSRTFLTSPGLPFFWRSFTNLIANFSSGVSVFLAALPASFFAASY